jgi:hypothetical protein
MGGGAVLTFIFANRISLRDLISLILEVEIVQVDITRVVVYVGSPSPAIGMTLAAHLKYPIAPEV